MTCLGDKTNHGPTARAGRALALGLTAAAIASLAPATAVATATPASAASVNRPPVTLLAEEPPPVDPPGRDDGRDSTPPLVPDPGGAADAERPEPGTSGVLGPPDPTRPVVWRTRSALQSGIGGVVNFGTDSAGNLTPAAKLTAASAYLLMINSGNYSRDRARAILTHSSTLTSAQIDNILQMPARRARLNSDGSVVEADGRQMWTQYANIVLWRLAARADVRNAFDPADIEQAVGTGWGLTPAQVHQTFVDRLAGAVHPDLATALSHYDLAAIQRNSVGGTYTALGAAMMMNLYVALRWDVPGSTDQQLSDAIAQRLRVQPGDLLGVMTRQNWSKLVPQ